MTVDAGEVLYVLNALQSNINGGPSADFLSTVKIGSNQVTVGINPFVNSALVYGPAVLAGPAQLVVSRDSAITFYRVKEAGFQSAILSENLPVVINVNTNTTCNLFPPLSVSGYYTKSFNGSKFDGDGITLTNVTHYPPNQISGPIVITLNSTGPGQSITPTIVTFQLVPTQQNVIAATAETQSIIVEGSANLVQWQPVFSTNGFRSSQGYFRIRSGN